MRSAWLVVVVGACGSPPETPRPAAAVVREASYDERSTDRLEVARVDGVPIYADCVATQAAGHAPPEAEARRAGLDDCIAFALLADEARRRGLTRDADAIEVQKREAVRALIDQDFAPTLDAASDVTAADLARYWPKLERFYNRTELRRTHYCRFKVEQKLPRGGPEDLAARALAEELHRRLAGRAVDRDALGITCKEIQDAHAVPAAAVDFIATPYSFLDDERTQRDYAAAAFAVPAVGGITPPTRTPWGWDIIVVTDIAPAVAKSFDEAVPELQDQFFYGAGYDGFRQSRFLAWAKTLGQATRVEVFPDRIPVSDELEAQALPAGPAPAPVPGEAR